MSEFTVDSKPIPSVSADEMAKVDRIATDVVDLHLLSMMENAGRTLAAAVRSRHDAGTPVTVLVGAGGNGGGGLVAARHLANAGWTVKIVCDRDPEQMTGVPGRQLRVLRETDAAIGTAVEDTTGTAVDALIGYGLRGTATGAAATLIDRTDAFTTVVSLDVPSGVDATTGEARGPVVEPDETLTLALPKAGLATARTGELSLADIGIPKGVFERAGIDYTDPFGGRSRVPLATRAG